ncbi:acyltransferase family protein [Phenylobacterium sp.]|uniref:acyltransferase family protein n=1 Tax=Phenylobacterium sp. TaxID=1871053 RepID=UPI0035231CBD
MSQLDGVRGLAILAVIIHHFLTHNINLIFASLGTVGVQLFFVASGFLITGILVRCRESILRNNTNIFHEIKTFYIRRSIRIFPLYYISLVTLIVFSAPDIREYALWLSTYTINLKMIDQEWMIATAAHFWSLAIEEQFYLIWPWIVLLLPFRWSLAISIFLVLAAIVTRSYYVYTWILLDYGDNLGAWMSTASNFDSLGIGSGIALAIHIGIANQCMYS